MSRVALVVLLTVASIGFGQSTSTVWQPPKLDIPDSVPKASISNEMLTTVHLGGVSVILEQTQLSEAQKRLGGGIGSRGDAGEALGWLCTVGSDAKGRWAFWLESSEMGGDTVDGFVWQQIPSDAVIDPRCVKKGIKVGLPVELGLGLTESEVRGILGVPTAKYRDTLVYVHNHAEEVRGEAFTSSNVIYIELRRDLVWTIQVWKTTSN